jgi:hypothetical protein
MLFPPYYNEMNPSGLPALAVKAFVTVSSGYAEARNCRFLNSSSVNLSSAKPSTLSSDH